METKYFDGYGWLEWLEPEDFFSESWSLYDRGKDLDDKGYDIVISGDKTEFRYTII